MTNIEKLNQAFLSSFQVDESELQGLKYKESPRWDSVGQMILISNIEDAFNIVMGPEDIMDIDSYESAKTIVAQNYGIVL